MGYFCGDLKPMDLVFELIWRNKMQRKVLIMSIFFLLFLTFMGSIGWINYKAFSDDESSPNSEDLNEKVVGIEKIINVVNVDEEYEGVQIDSAMDRDLVIFVDENNEIQRIFTEPGLIENVDEGFKYRLYYVSTEKSNLQYIDVSKFEKIESLQK